MEGILLLAVLWALVNFIGRATRRQQGGEPDAEAEARARREAARREAARRRTVARPRQLPAPERPPPDPAEEWRREIERLLGIGTGGADRGPLGRQAPAELPEAEEVEEVESLEVEPEVESLEVLTGRPEREVLDQDDEAEEVLQRRLAAAEVRTRGRGLADHRKFDQRIRAVSPAPGPVARRRPSLRQAMVWREVLGPPVSLR